MSSVGGGRSLGNDRKILQFTAVEALRLSEKPFAERVVLLQGPVGPFFKHLQSYLAECDFDVWRICFNPADLFFSRRKNRINFRGNLTDWESWFRDFVEGAHVDRIVLFGAERPVHRMARQIGLQAGIPVVSLEEGYIRPGFITAEEGGNNASSPLAGRLPPSEPLEEEHTAGEDFRAFSRMASWGALYYGLRSLLSFGKQKKLFHRPISLHTEIFYWDGTLSGGDPVITQVTDNNCSRIYNLNPAIYDGTITWRTSGNSAAMFYWNGTDITQVSENYKMDGFFKPAINSAGIAYVGRQSMGYPEGLQEIRLITGLE